MITVRSIGSPCLRSVLIVIGLVGPVCTYAQSADSTLTATSKFGRSDHSPTGALLRSAAVPGWGQSYNRQYYKVPIVLAALGGLTAIAINNHKEFKRYNRAYLYGVYIDEDPHPFQQYEADYLEFSGASTSALRSRRDLFRRNRDLTAIGLFVAYSLNLLDAYVSGHLFDFDVGEDLSSLHDITRSSLTMTLRLRL